MTDEKQQKKDSIREALQSRIQTEPIMEDELIEQSLNEATAEAQLLGEEEQILEIPLSPPQKKEAIPALVLPIVSQSEVPVSSQASQVVPINDADFQALNDYIFGDSFNQATVAYVIAAICTQAGGTPHVGTWDIPTHCDIPELVYTILTTKGYLQEIWPFLRLIMGSNAGNSVWTAGVAVSIAFYDSMKFLPILCRTQNIPVEEKELV